MFILPWQAVFALIIPLSLTKYSIIWNISNVVLTSQALGHASFIAAASHLCCSALAATSICKVTYCTKRFSPLVQMAGHSLKLWPVVDSKVWLQWLLWPISLHCSDVKQSQERVKPQNVAGEWIWLIYRHSFPQWTLQPPISLKWDVYSCMRKL